MLSRRDQNIKSFLCLDIGSSSVKASVFEEVGGALQLMGIGEVSQELGNVQGGTIVHLADVIHHVQVAVKQAENQSRHLAKDLIIGISGEAVRGTSMILEFQRDKPKSLIDAQEWKGIIYQLHWKAYELIRQSIAEEIGMRVNELKLINASIGSMMVDGEIVDDVKGMSGKIVSLEIFQCFAPVNQFGQIQNIAVELPFHELRGVFVHGFSVCHAFSLLDRLESSMVIDIGAGTTDIGVLLDGKIVGQRSFALGGNNFTKRISHELLTSFGEAESMKLGYAEGGLEKRSHHVIRDAFRFDTDLWMTSLIFSLHELKLRHIPNKIFLCGNGSLLPEFRDALSSYDWKAHFPCKEEVQVRYLEYQDLIPNQEIDTARDFRFLPLIALAITGYDLLYHNAAVETILENVLSDHHPS